MRPWQRRERYWKSFFFVDPEAQMELVGRRLVLIIEAATDAALRLQRGEMLKVSNN